PKTWSITSCLRPALSRPQGLSDATNSLRGADVRQAKVRLPRRAVLPHRARALHRVSVLGNRDAEALNELRRVARPGEAVRIEHDVVPARDASHVEVEHRARVVGVVRSEDRDALGISGSSIVECIRTNAPPSIRSNATRPRSVRPGRYGCEPVTVQIPTARSSVARAGFMPTVNTSFSI